MNVIFINSLYITKQLELISSLLTSHSLFNLHPHITFYSWLCLLFYYIHFLSIPFQLHSIYFYVSLDIGYSNFHVIKWTETGICIQFLFLFKYSFLAKDTYVPLFPAVAHLFISPSIFPPLLIILPSIQVHLLAPVCFYFCIFFAVYE